MGEAELRAELDALRAEHQAVKKLLDHAPSALFTWRRAPVELRQPDGAGGSFDHVTARMEELTGLGADLMRSPNVTVSNLIAPEARRGLFERIDEAERTLLPLALAVPILHPDG